MKRIVGIVPTARLFETDDYYQDNYVFVNNYGLRVWQNGGVPMGVLAGDGLAFEEALDRCDALLICGGGKIFPYHFQAVHHAVVQGKPLLGICLGMQVIHSYFVVADEAKRRGETDLMALYDKMKREKYMFTHPVAHHWDVHMVRGHIDETKHDVRVVPHTLLERLAGPGTIRGATMHRYAVGQPSDQLTVSGYAGDGVIEALEYGDRVLGVQFHPEVDRTFDALFEFLAGRREA